MFLPHVNFVVHYYTQRRWDTISLPSSLIKSWFVDIRFSKDTSSSSYPSNHWKCFLAEMFFIPLTVNVNNFEPSAPTQTPSTLSKTQQEIKPAESLRRGWTTQKSHVQQLS